jgi:hypothetical protein
MICDILMRYVNIFPATTLLAASPLHAAELVSASDIPSVAAALAAAGFRAELRRDDDGARYFSVDDDAQGFSLGFGDCADEAATTGCKLLIFGVSWTSDDGLDVDIANRFNRDATLAHAFVDDDGALFLTLVVTTSGGLTTENFAAVLAEWQAADRDLSARLDTPPEAPGGAVIASLSAR